MNHTYTSIIRIAEKVVPDEVDLAPAVFDAALEGGQQWEELLHPVKGPELGGVFGGVAGGEMTQLLDALIISAPFLLGLLSVSSTTLSMVVSIMTIREKKELSQKIENIKEDEADLLIKTISSTVQHLIKLGVKDDRANEMSQLTIQALLEKPEESKQFINLLSKKKS